MTHDRQALLERIQGGELVEIDGRTAYDEAGLDAILGTAPTDQAEGQENQAEGQGTNTDETTEPIVLSRGSAVLTAVLPAIGEGTEPRWSAPGDFTQYLQFGHPSEGDGQLAGLVREILVGDWRSWTEGDASVERGEFLAAGDVEQLRRAIAGDYQAIIEELRLQIGITPREAQTPEELPTGGSWLAERASWKQTVDALTARVAELELLAAAPKTEDGAPKTEATAPTEPEPAPVIEPVKKSGGK